MPATWAGWFLGYAGWLVSAAAWLLLGFYLRGTIAVVGTALGASRWLAIALDRYGIVLIVLVWLVLTMATEPYYSEGVRMGTLRRRFAKVLALQVSAGLILLLLDRLVLWLA